MSTHFVRRTAVAATLALAALPAAAAAAPAPPTARALRPHGLRVTWPVRGASATVAPGTVLTVTVRPLGERGRRAGLRRPRAATARVSLVRLAASGGAARTLSTRRVRDGRVSVRLPASAGVTYALRLRVGRKLFESRVVVPGRSGVQPRPAPPARPASPAPPSPPTTYPDCVFPGVEPRLAVDSRISASWVIPGQTITYRATNVGSCVSMRIRSDRFQRQLPDGSWIEADRVVHPVPADVIRFPPGDTVHGGETIALDAPLGRYRFVPPVGGPLEFEVVSPCPIVGDRTTSKTELLDDVVRTGDRVYFIVHNTGGGCLSYDGEVTVERRTGPDTWEDTGYGEPAGPQKQQLFPGLVLARSLEIPADAPAGTYRVLFATVGDPTAEVPTFEVTAAG